NIRSGPGLEYPTRYITYSGDRVQVIESARNSDNFIWYKIYFPKSEAEGWIAGNLLAVDGQQTQQTSPPPKPPSLSSQTNATVGGDPGTKNLRSGAGTIYGVIGKVRTGDRVQIMGSSYDRGNYQWLQVYDPQ
ncbi:MAG: SH3 domain-containing protein, partial [Microcystis sp.]